MRLRFGADHDDLESMLVADHTFEYICPIGGRYQPEAERFD
jgi:hypothetical protein